MNKGQREQSIFFVDVNDDADKGNDDVIKDRYEMYLTKVIWEEHVSLFFVMIVQQQKRTEKNCTTTAFVGIITWLFSPNKAGQDAPPENLFFTKTVEAETINLNFQVSNKLSQFWAEKEKKQHLLKACVKLWQHGVNQNCEDI